MRASRLPAGSTDRIERGIYESFAYVPNSTKVDSPIEEALQTRQGVCQDFAHIMTALARPLRIPCRYVSGYLFHREAEDGRRIGHWKEHPTRGSKRSCLVWVGPLSIRRTT